MGVAGCVFACLFLTVFRWADNAACVSRAARHFGIEASNQALYDYVQNQLTPGMTRDEVLVTLRQIGPVSVDQGTEALNGQIADTVRLNICWHPMNSIILFARYSADDSKLISTRIEADD